MTFTGRTVLVTGAARGIGRATAAAFVQAGATVAANHLGEQAEIRTLARQLEAAPGRLLDFDADVSQSAEVQGMVEAITARTGGIDILINNAGISMIKPFLELSEADWDRIIDVDLKSVFLCSQAVLPGMLARGDGVIVNLASELGYLGRARFSAYTAAKGGVISLTRSLALEFAPGIRVNAVAPGPTRTPMLEAEHAVPGHEEPAEDIPMQRYAQPEEIADSILFIASDKARYYCGEVISPNGGTLMR